MQLESIAIHAAGESIARKPCLVPRVNKTRIFLMDTYVMNRSGLNKPMINLLTRQCLANNERMKGIENTFGENECAGIQECPDNP
jgi:hypothetical protein